MSLRSRILAWLPKSAPRTKTFRYKYQRHPFDSPQYFSVQALDQADANVLAKQKFTEMFNNRQTVMQEFYPAA